MKEYIDKLLTQAGTFFSKIPMRVKVLTLSLTVCAGVVLVICLTSNGGSDALEASAVFSSADTCAISDEALSTKFKALFELNNQQLPADTSRIHPLSMKKLSYGMNDYEVSMLQSRLMELGFLAEDEPTEYFGPATKQAVKAFQRQHGIKQTGNAGTKTLRLLFSSSAQSYCVTEGADGADVCDIQERLKYLCYMEDITGYYGTVTIDAVKSFQTKNSLPVTGNVDSDTREKIFSENIVAGAGFKQKEYRRGKIVLFMEYARKQLGKRYSLGSTGPNYFDCSGLVYYCLRKAGSNRGRLSAAGYSQVTAWEKISSYSGLEKGDLLFFYNDTRSKVGHVGIYIGGGMMIDASTSAGRITRRPINTSYWRARFVFARRPW